MMQFITNRSFKVHDFFFQRCDLKVVQKYFITNFFSVITPQVAKVYCIHISLYRKHIAFLKNISKYTIQFLYKAKIQKIIYCLLDYFFFKSQYSLHIEDLKDIKNFGKTITIFFIMQFPFSYPLLLLHTTSTYICQLIYISTTLTILVLGWARTSDLWFIRQKRYEPCTDSMLRRSYVYI